MARTSTQYRCTACGYKSVKALGRCPNCGAWDSFKEEAPEAPKPKSGLRIPAYEGGGRIVRLRDAAANLEERFSSGLGELDRVLGGGFVKGEVLLVGGEPGVGKSTILLQVAHPLVAAGVAEHSYFAADARGRLRRLQHTLDAMLTLTFGSYEEAVAVARHIDGIHGRVHGTLPEATGRFPAGTPYSARDPALLRWVHATYVDTALITYQLYIGPLTRAEQDRYCQEASGIEPLLHIPEGYLPRDVDSLRAYLESMLTSGEIAVGPTARRIARELGEEARAEVAKVSFATTTQVMEGS
ncbi:MAG: oxygenase MpaB family protein, partial [Meiothermus silvanus]|nr:oxygenase MpaB family protein [Allomeiothermus silvanus]